MVKKWIKQLILLEKTTNIDFDTIIFDILSWNYEKYDQKELTWYNNLYRVRVWWYRIIFRNEKNNIKILLVWTRGSVYKQLKTMFW
jgi:mRNA-degrading endonuclease RelE of RelBE toxin-antitoxin system